MLRLRVFRFLLRLPRFRGASRLVELYRRAFLRRAVTTCHGGIRMELDVWEWPQVELLRDGTLEPLTVARFEQLLEAGDTYVDVGAHVGFHALVARRAVGAEGRILAIDPQPENCARCLTNFRLNGYDNLVSISAAAGDETGWIELADQALTDRSRLTLAGDGVNDEGRKLWVRTLRLSDLLGELEVERVRLVKIDVEGFEAEVVAGLAEGLGKVENLVIELLPETLPRASTQDLLRTLTGAGFELLTVEGQPWQSGMPLPENNLWAGRP